MKTVYGSLMAVVAMLVIACGGGTTPTNDGGTGGGSGGGSGGDSGVVDAGVKLDTGANILAYLDGKTLTMEGANLPASPNGYPSNVYYGNATQCYKNTVITVADGKLNVHADLGKITDGGVAVTTVGQAGLCDTTTTTVYTNSSNSVSFDALGKGVKNNGECFDFSVAYSGGVNQEGRGSVTANQLKLEIFFTGQFTGITCADGNPGSATIKKGGNAVTLNSVQTYVITK